MGNNEKPLEAEGNPTEGRALSCGCYENVSPELASQQVQPAIPGVSGEQLWPTQSRKLPSSPCGFGEVSPDISSGSSSRLRLWPEFCGTS